MFRHSSVARVLARYRSSVTMANDVHLSSRRVMRKIKPGKARPAIFHQFDTLVELSDGSVIRRRSQAPKDEIRMILDMRNSSLWNPHRSDLNTTDPNATGKINMFKQRFGDFSPLPEKGADDKPAPQDDELLALMGQNVQQVQSGGKLFDRKKNRVKDRK